MEDGGEMLRIQMDIIPFYLPATSFRHYRRSVKQLRGTWVVKRVQCTMG